ncbi:uncharacterized protein EDB91DRAFT_1086128 [Suillus paluster]|uniref:uncharacterized protein n=1 Tax=Suillus paluster TaxID=48578 RepID=UPI001B877702|nr:uncharacterized protein EDB91DRAFT_1086128 [Suillus paluster]KAG1728406.1 hypothetical protein EDB91DRAFT_1086128 [Suillus paluster]
MRSPCLGTPSPSGLTKSPDSLQMGAHSAFEGTVRRSTHSAALKHCRRATKSFAEDSRAAERIRKLGNWSARLSAKASFVQSMTPSLKLSYSAWQRKEAKDLSDTDEGWAEPVRGMTVGGVGIWRLWLKLRWSGYAAFYFCEKNEKTVLGPPPMSELGSESRSTPRRISLIVIAKKPGDLKWFRAGSIALMVAVQAHVKVPFALSHLTEGNVESNPSPSFPIAFTMTSAPASTAAFSPPPNEERNH